MSQWKVCAQNWERFVVKELVNEITKFKRYFHYVGATCK